jgi:hypothetical protein
MRRVRKESRREAKERDWKEEQGKARKISEWGQDGAT